MVKCGITATKFRVHEHAARGSRDQAHGARSDQHGQHIGTITCAEASRSAIDQSALSRAGKARAKALFDRLAEAEAAIHNMPVEKVHLHEVGALDSIIDIVGAVFALEWFGADRIVVSPINVGSGMVQDGARPLSGAGAGDAAAARRRAGLRRRDRERSC